ncbi:MAG: metallophosphoesterase [Methanotrichaceae archaeon]
MISTIFDEPLLMVEKEQRVLVAADIHLGLEYELWLGGASIPSQTGRILERLIRNISELKPDRLVLVGDVKHNVPKTSWQERQEVPYFLKELCRHVKVEIVPGNHDSGIANMAPSGTSIQPSSGFVLDGVGYFHGHTWPSIELLDSELLIAGHIHPALRLKDPIGHSTTMRVFARVPLSAEAILKQYGFDKTPEMMIMPAFNDLCGGMPLNEISPEDERGPILTMADIDMSRICLLDGIDLGTLKEIKSSIKRQG